MTQLLRDYTGKLIGKIVDRGYRLEIRDATGKLLGWYLPSTNQTKESNGRLFGKGNLLTMLLN